MARTPVTEAFTRSNSVRVIGEPEVYRESSGRLEWHIYKIAGEDKYALIGMGVKGRPGVRPGIHGVFTGGTQDEYRNWLKEGHYKKVDKSHA